MNAGTVKREAPDLGCSNEHQSLRNQVRQQKGETPCTTLSFLRRRLNRSGESELGHGTALGRKRSTIDHDMPTNSACANRRIGNVGNPGSNWKPGVSLSPISIPRVGGGRDRITRFGHYSPCNCRTALGFECVMWNVSLLLLLYGVHDVHNTTCELTRVCTSCAPVLCGSGHVGGWA